MAHSPQYIEVTSQWSLLLAVAFYAAHVIFYFVAMQCLLHIKRLMSLSCTILLLVLAQMGITFYWTRVAFVENRDYSGGSNQFLLNHVDSYISMAVTVVYIGISAVADGPIFERFYFLGVCGFASGSWYRKTFLFFTTVLCSTALIVVGINLKLFPSIEGHGVNPGSRIVTPRIAYIALSLSINTTLTVFIIARLFLLRRKIPQIMALHDMWMYRSESFAAMLIESVALYTVAALFAVIACWVNSPM